MSIIDYIIYRIDPSIVAFFVLICPVLGITIVLHYWPRFYMYFFFKKLAKKCGYSFKKISFLPFKFILKINQNDIHFHLYGIKGTDLTAEVTLDIETDVDVEIKVTDWFEEAVEYCDKKMGNNKSYEYLFDKRFIIIRSNIEKEKIVALFGSFLSKALAKIHFGLWEIHIKNNKIILAGIAKPFYKPNYLYTKMFENLIKNFRNQFTQN